MCRLAAFPPGTSADQAHEIVAKFVKGNDDGVGECYVEKGEFKLNKYPYSYQQAVSKKDKLFNHMPYEGWTIAHVRMATHGGNEYRNTHPIIKGNIAVVHNGVFSDSKLVRAALADSVKWSGETDTEVAAYMLNKLGPLEFYKAMPQYSGVYLALNRDGTLNAVKLSGDLEIYRNENDTFILASEFPFNGSYWNKKNDTSPGILKLDKEGHAINFSFRKNDEKKEYSSRGTQSGRYGNACTADSRTSDPCTTYTRSDIGYGGMSRNVPPTHVSGPAEGAGVTKDSAKPGIMIPKKDKKVMDLWDWFTPEELEHSQEMME